MPYSKMSEANPSLKGIKPPVSLAQANAIAAIADKVTGVESPWAVAISQFKKSHVAKDGKWVKKEGSEFGKKKKEIIDKATRLIDALKQLVVLERPVDKEICTGIKALIERDGSQYVVLWTANAFRDIEKEIFSTKALEDYVARADSVGNYGRVWFWHVTGSDFADIAWQGVQGRILLEVAKVDATEYGQKMFYALEHPEQWPDLLPRGWGTSHGYVYRAGDKQDGVYNFMHKFETTVLPLHKASNWFGGVRQLLDTGGGIMAEVTAEKAAGLVALVGEDMAKQLLADAAKVTADLEGLVDFKEEDDDEEKTGSKGDGSLIAPVKKKVKKVAGEEEEDEDEEEEDEDEGEEKGSTKEADDNLFEVELTDELLKEIATHVPVDVAVKEAVAAILPIALKSYRDEIVKAVGEAVAQATIASKEAVVQEALAGKMKLVPYTASKDAGTVISDPDGAIKEADKSDGGDVVTAVVQRMLTGV